MINLIFCERPKIETIGLILPWRLKVIDKVYNVNMTNSYTNSSFDQICQDYLGHVCFNSMDTETKKNVTLTK